MLPDSNSCGPARWYSTWCPRLAMTGVLLALAGSSLQATELLNTQGFEGYTVGPLKNQFEGPTLWLTSGNGGGSAVIESTSGMDGTKGVRVDRQASSYDWWAVPFTGAGLPNNRFVTVDWDMKVNSTGGGSGVYGPFFGVDVYDAGIYPAFPEPLATFGVDATTRDLVYQDPLSLVESGYFVDFGWNHYQIQLDYLTNTYDVLANYEVLNESPIPFVSGASDSFGDANIAAYAGNADITSDSLSGTAYLDNFRIRESDILAGDFNNDGTVDLADYTVWRNHLGASTEIGIANAGDGLNGVDATDYLVWRGQFGKTTAVAATALAVPEPASALLVAVLSVALASLSRGSFGRG